MIEFGFEGGSEGCIFRTEPVDHRQHDFRFFEDLSHGDQIIKDPTNVINVCRHRHDLFLTVRNCRRRYNTRVAEPDKYKVERAFHTSAEVERLATCAMAIIIIPTTMAAASSILSFPCRINSLSHLHRDRGVHVSIPIGAGRGGLHRLGLLHQVGRQHSSKVAAIKATTAQDDNEKEESSEIVTPAADESENKYTTAEAPEFLNTFPEPLRAFLKWIFSFLIGIWKRIQIASVVFKKADEVAERIEDIADKVGDAAREIAEELPDDAPMKGVVLKVQDIAEDIEEGADNIDNVLDKITDSIDDMGEKIEECMEEAEERKEEQDSGNAR